MGMGHPLSFGALLKHLRRAAQMTQAELAEKAGYSTSYISQVERGEKTPIAATVELLAHALLLDAHTQQQLLQTLHPETAVAHPSPVPAMSMPQPVKPLIGRHQILRLLIERLTTRATNGLLALWGLPGVGKTTLSLAVAHHPEIAAHFSDGIFWAGLGPTGQPLTILQSWARLLGLEANDATQATDSVTLSRALQHGIGQRRILFVIDDAWHLEDALVLRIGGPHCAHLLTTRFPPLAAQFAHEEALQVRELSGPESRMLLHYLAPSAFQDEAATSQTQALVQTAGGLPLALTLIGHYLHSQTISGQPRRIQSALQHVLQAAHRLALAEPYPPIERPSHVAPDTQRSLAAVIALSMGVLPAEAQTLLQHLTLFPPKPNTFAEDAACAVGFGDRPDILAHLDLLLDAGLLESAEPGRYQLHQTIVDYVRLSASDAAAQLRFVSYFIAYAQTHAAQHAALELELPNMLTALDVAYALQAPMLLVQLTEALANYWHERGALAQFVKQLARLHAMPALVAHPPALLTTLWHLGRMALEQGDLALAATYAHDGVTAALQQADAQRLSDFYLVFGLIAARQHNDAQAQFAYTASLLLARTQQPIPDILALLITIHPIDDHVSPATAYYRDILALGYQENAPNIITAALHHLGTSTGQRGHFDEAMRYFSEALSLAHVMDYARQRASLLHQLGRMLLAQGHLTKAHTHLQESLAQAAAIEYTECVINNLALLAELMMLLGETDLAYAYLHEGSILARQSHQAMPLLHLLLSAGRVALQEHDLNQAEEVLQEALVIARHTHAHLLLCSCLISWGQLCLGREQFAEALHAFDEALHIATQRLFQGPMGLAWFGIAQVMAREGHPAAARHAAEKSSTLLAALGSRHAAQVERWRRTTLAS